MIKNKLTKLFAVVAAVGLIHYGATGLEDILTSASVGIYAGWGAIVFDIFNHYFNQEKGNSPSQLDFPQPPV